MRTIWKWKLDPNCQIEMPKGAQILDVQVQHGEPHIWGLVDTNEPVERRYFSTYGTGHVVPNNVTNYIGSFQLNGGSLVFHVFEE